MIPKLPLPETFRLLSILDEFNAVAGIVLVVIFVPDTSEIFELFTAESIIALVSTLESPSSELPIALEEILRTPPEVTDKPLPTWIHLKQMLMLWHWLNQNCLNQLQN